jgi:carbonic anhydrase
MLEDLKSNNLAWSLRKTEADPQFFKRLEGQQSPEYLWIGCSDSRVPANEIVGLDPGELFVHRNVANLAPPQDANYLSVLQFAVDVIKVKHVMVVGHYGCGGVAAAIDGQRRGLVDHWLHPIREVHAEHKHELDALPTQKDKLNRLCELNVIRQVRNVASDVFVQDAWARGQPLSVHGWVYSLGNGLVTDLNVGISSLEDYERVASGPAERQSWGRTNEDLVVRTGYAGAQSVDHAALAETRRQQPPQTSRRVASGEPTSTELIEQIATRPRGNSKRRETTGAL